MIAFIMGQALYNSQLEYFRTHEFYNDGSISPFLLPQIKDGVPVGDTLFRLETLTGNMKVATGIIRHPVSEMEFSKSIDEIEDHYIDQVEVRDRVMDTHPYVIYHVNAQSSGQGAINRRGTGWIVLLNPRTFEKIVEASPDLGDIWDGDPAPKIPRQIGRWTLAGNKPDRCQHFWTADHISEDEIITVYRGTNLTQTIDGLVILPRDDGFYYPAESPRGYVWRFKLVTKTETENTLIV